VYVPAPWWLTNYFEVRDADGNIRQRFSERLDGDGLRYEIAEFQNLIKINKIESFKFSFNEMLYIVTFLERFSKEKC
jgi:hypothetical protein